MSVREAYEAHYLKGLQKNHGGPRTNFHRRLHGESKHYQTDIYAVTHLNALQAQWQKGEGA